MVFAFSIFDCKVLCGKLAGCKSRIRIELRDDGEVEHTAFGQREGGDFGAGLFFGGGFEEKDGAGLVFATPDGAEDACGVEVADAVGFEFEELGGEGFGGVDVHAAFGED
jgi:hypothetical protein